MSEKDGSAAFETTVALISDADGADAASTLGWTLGSPVSDDTVAAPSVVSGVSGLPALSYGDVAPGSEGGRHDLEVLGELGRGGMGVVLHAKQHSLNREVAIKCVTPEHRDKIEARALLFEAKITGSLEHPNIVPVHALGVDADGGPSMVMKRISGVEWNDLIHDPDHEKWRELPSDRLRFHLETLIQVCHAVAFAHNSGIVHRDIKPQNVMVGSFGEVVLLDWGVALRRETVKGDGPPMAVVGTPAYMAPEMALGGTHDHRTDVYLLGATLYELLMGDAPHDGDTLSEVLHSAASARAPSFDDDVPTELAEICARALAPDPEDRFTSVEEMRRALERYLEHRSSNALVAQSLIILERLEDAAQREAASEELTALRQSYAECRFGLRQALLAWEDSPEAAAGLERCLLSAAAIELVHGNADIAEALLDELDEPSETMLERLAALREERARTEERLASLERDARERDASVSARTRGMAFMALTAVMLVTVIVVEVGLRAFDYTPTHLDAVLANVGIFIAVVLAYPLYYRRVEKTQHNLTPIRVIFVYTPFTVVLRAVGWMLALPVATILTIEILTCALTCGLLAATFDKRFAWAAGLALVPLGVAMLRPDLSFPLLAMVEIGALLWIGGAWYLHPNAPSESPKADRRGLRS